MPVLRKPFTRGPLLAWKHGHGPSHPCSCTYSVWTVCIQN